MNHVAEALTGYGADEALGMKIDEVLRLVDPDGKRVDNPVWTALDKVADGQLPPNTNHSTLKEPHFSRTGARTARPRQDAARASLVKAGACIVAEKPLEYEEATRAVGECRARGGPGRCHMRSRPRGHQLVPLRRK